MEKKKIIINVNDTNYNRVKELLICIKNIILKDKIKQ